MQSSYSVRLNQLLLQNTLIPNFIFAKMLYSCHNNYFERVSNILNILSYMAILKLAVAIHIVIIPIMEHYDVGCYHQS